MATRLLKLAVIYLIAGMSLGLFMGITQELQFHSVHAHINLLGWVSLAVAGFIFHLFPDLARTRLAAIYFWLYNLSLPAGLALTVAGYAWAEPILGIGFTAVWAAGCIFGANVLLHLTAERQSVSA